MSSIYKLKVHKVDKKTWDLATRKRKKDGFVLTIEIKTLCGLDGIIIAHKWSAVTCKKCHSFKKESK